MCRPTSTIADQNLSHDDVAQSSSTTEEAAATATATEESSSVAAHENLRRGTLLGCLSLGLLVSGFAITMPHLQSRRDELGCDALCYGSMTSVRSALGLVGSAFVGRLSDSDDSMLARAVGGMGVAATTHLTLTGAASKSAQPSGRRACLYVGAAASLVGLLVASSTNSLQGLWISLIPGALLQHNFDVMKATMADYHGAIEQGSSSNTESPSSSRSGSVGKLGMTAGLAFMIGPMVASMGANTFHDAARLAILFTLVSGLLVYLLPIASPGLTAAAEKKHPPIPTKSSTFALSNFVNLKAAQSPAALVLIVLRTSMALAFHVFQTIWPTSLKARFNFGPADHGRFMSFVGLTYAFSQGFVAKRAIAPLGPKGKVRLMMACCLALGVGRYVAFRAESLVTVYASFVFVINALGILNTIITADTGAVAPPNEVGGLFGTLQSVESAAGMLGPFLGGSLSYYFDNGLAPLSAVVGIYVFLAFFVYWGYEKYVLGFDGRTGKSNVHVESEAKKSDQPKVKDF